MIFIAIHYNNLKEGTEGGRVRESAVENEGEHFNVIFFLRSVEI